MSQYDLMTDDRLNDIRAQFEAHVRGAPAYHEGQLDTRRDGGYASIQTDNWFTGFVMAVRAGAA